MTTISLVDQLRAARSHGLSSINHILSLMEIHDAETLRFYDLASRLGVSAAAVTQIADHLVKLSLAYREHATADRRAIYLRITPKGREITSLITA